jgi:hypothetical protein
MILNILDRRKQNYRWKCVDAIIEPTWHDNACADSDYAEHDHGEPMYEARKGISLADAVMWASGVRVPVTLYIYDKDSGTVPDESCSLAGQQ